MFFVLLCFVIAIFFSWLVWVEDRKIIKSIGIGSVLASLIFFAILMIRPATYQENAQYLSEIELMQLNSDEESPIYVVKTDKLKYSYKPIGNKNTEEKEIIEANNIYLDIVQSDNCEKPVLKKYSRKTKWEIFSIGGIQRIEYVFYIPTGTYQGRYHLE